ncbi:MAG: VOC family protein, partial [Actinomycetota bacterium]|nr:VOC family protein [Actinomycetota bacterium]
QRSAAFYEALGWVRSSASTDDVAFFQTPQAVLSLYLLPLMAAEIGVDLVQDPGFHGVATAINVESEAEVEAVLKSSLDAGGTVPRPGSRADWGGYNGYFADPDGHLWEVAHNPFFPLDADGSVTVP